MLTHDFRFSHQPEYLISFECLRPFAEVMTWPTERLLREGREGTTYPEPWHKGAPRQIALEN